MLLNKKMLGTFGDEHHPHFFSFKSLSYYLLIHSFIPVSTNAERYLGGKRICLLLKVLKPFAKISVRVPTARVLGEFGISEQLNHEITE